MTEAQSILPHDKYPEHPRFQPPDGPWTDDEQLYREWIQVKTSPTAAKEIWENPHFGDILCYDGKQWKVSRRNGFAFYVPDGRSKEEQE